MTWGWDFFGIPYPEYRSRGFEIRIFYFGLDQKNFGFLRFSDGFLVSGFLLPRFGIFLSFGIFMPGIFAKSARFGIFRDFLPSEYLGFFFRWMGYPDKKPTLLILTFQKKWRSKPNSLQEEILRIKFSSLFNHQDTSWHSSLF